MPAKGQFKSHCVHGHLRTEETVDRANGGCIPCARARTRKFYQTEHGKALHAARQRAWTKDNPTAALNIKLKVLYGITLEQRDSQIVEQDNKCAACRKPFGEKRKPETDHDHDTEQVRGQLCHSCNKALGFAQDDIEVLLSLVEYLRKYQNKSAATTAL